MANLSKPLNQGFAAPSIVANYGPYVSIAAAHTALADDGLNVIGMTVGITGADNTIVEYWYQGGTALSNLVPKKPDLAAVATSGSYNDLSNKPTIPVVPTNVSAFTNDSGYLVAADIAGKADKADTYTKTEVDEKIDDIIGGEINLQNYYTKSEVDASQQAQDTAIAAKAPQATTYTKTEVNNLLSPKANSADLATVATSGSYNDLTDKPDIPAPVDVSGKADKTYVDTALAQKANTNDVNTALAGKANASDVYTKEEGQALESSVNEAIETQNTQLEDRLDEQDRAISLFDRDNVIVVADHTAVASPETQKIYRQPNNASNPTAYTDWMYQDNIWKEIATYTFPGIDDNPTYNSNKLIKSGSVYALQEESVGYSDFVSVKNRLSVAQNGKYINQYGDVKNNNGSFITTALQVYEGDVLKITGHFYPGGAAISIVNDGTYTAVSLGSTAYNGTGSCTWIAPKDCSVVFSGYLWYDAVISMKRASKVESRMNKLLWKKKTIEFTDGMPVGFYVNPTVTVDSTFPFSTRTENTSVQRGIFEVKEGDKVYISKLPSILNNFYGYCILDEDCKVIVKGDNGNEICFEVPTGGKYVVFQCTVSGGYPDVYVQSLEDTNDIDTDDYDLLPRPTVSVSGSTLTAQGYSIGNIGTKATKATSNGYKGYCYSCSAGDEFIINDACPQARAFAVVDEHNMIIARDTKPTGFWHYRTKIVIPEGGTKLLVNTSDHILSGYKIRCKRQLRDIYPEKNPIVNAASLVLEPVISYNRISGTKSSTRRLVLSWASDTHGDVVNYKCWIDWTNRYSGVFDAALHTGDFNRMGDADNGFAASALAYRTTIPFMPVLGNHDCFSQNQESTTLNSGSLEWNGNKYIKPFTENDAACVVGSDNCYYYRDFTDKKIRVIVINDYDKPRWADGTNWITTTDETEIANAVEWTNSSTSYAVGDVVHYKGMYVKCKVAGVLDDNAHVYNAQAHYLVSKTPTSCRYISQAQVNFIVNAMNVASGWGIVFVTHEPYELLPADEHCISKWTLGLERTLINVHVGAAFGQNGYMIQDLITAYLNKTTLNKTYECITPTNDPTGTVVKTNLTDFYPNVTVNADFTSAAGDIICCLNGHQHADTAYWSQHTGEKKVLCIGAPTDCYVPYDSDNQYGFVSADISKNGGAKDCFNVISIDTTEKAVYLVRIGADMTDQFEKRDYVRISYDHNQ